MQPLCDPPHLGHVALVERIASHDRAERIVARDQAPAVLRPLEVCAREEARAPDSYYSETDLKTAAAAAGEVQSTGRPECTLDQTMARANELADKVRALKISDRGQTVGQLTVSMGVAAYPRHGETSEDLLRMADAALYAAKQAGRDRIIAAADPT